MNANDRNECDDAVAEAVFERYSARLLALARANISKRLAQRIDSEDVVQSVFRTFFRRASEGEFAIDGSVDLWQLLSAITLRKVRSKAREHGAKKRDMASEAKSETMDNAAAQTPSPEDAMILVDLLESLLEDAGDVQREVLALRLAGHTQTEIARQQKISRQTVNRVLGRFKTQLQTLTTSD